MADQYIKEDTPVVTPAPVLLKPVPKAKPVDALGDLKEISPLLFSTKSEITTEPPALSP